MSGKAYGIVLHIALLTLCGVTLVLAQQNRRFHKMMNPEPPPIKTGYQATTIEVSTLDGSARTLAWPTSEQERLLFIFTTTCPACQENQSNWQALHQRMGRDLEIIGVSLDPIETTASYRAELQFPFEIMSVVNREAFLDDFDIATVPFTLHIDADGVVRGAWRGVLSSDTLDQIEASAGPQRG